MGDGPGCCSIGLHTGFAGGIVTPRAMQPSAQASG